MAFDTGAIVNEAIQDAPAVIKLVEMAVELIKTWETGGEGAKAQAEAAAQAAVAAMQETRKATADAHAQRMAEAQAEIDKPHLEAPHPFDTSDTK